MPFSNKKTFFEGIRDESVRHEIVSENIIEGLAFQIAALRKARGWTEQDLAARCEVHQNVIEKWEDPNRSKKTFAPFLRLAQALDVAFIARFAPFGELADWFVDLSPKKLAPPSYGEELEQQILHQDAVEIKRGVEYFQATAEPLIAWDPENSKQPCVALQVRREKALPDRHDANDSHLKLDYSAAA